MYELVLLTFMHTAAITNPVTSNVTCITNPVTSNVTCITNPVTSNVTYRLDVNVSVGTMMRGNMFGKTTVMRPAQVIVLRNVEGHGA